MEDHLNRGIVHWEGIARNVEYLGLPTEIKVFLGRWYSNWLLPGSCRPCCHPCSPGDDDESDIELDFDDDEDEEEEEEEEETDEDEDAYSIASSRGGDADAIADFERGRTRTIRPLARLCGKLQMCRA